LENIATDRDGIRLALNDGGAREGNLFVYSPRRLQMGEVRGCAVTGLADLGNSIWKISIAERKKTGLQIVHLEIGDVPHVSRFHEHGCV